MRTLPWLGIAMLAVCVGAHAQTIHKCVGKDGKIAYSNNPCPGSKETETRSPPPAVKGAVVKKESAVKKEPAARPAAAASGIPGMQDGRWKLRYTRSARANDNQTCGDPIDAFRREVQNFAASAKKAQGCTMTRTASGPRNVTVVYDCPSRLSPEGRPAQKERSELSLVSASPQSFRLEMNSSVYPGYVMEGTRIGDCTK